MHKVLTHGPWCNKSPGPYPEDQSVEIQRQLKVDMQFETDKTVEVENEMTHMSEQNEQMLVVNSNT